MLARLFITILFCFQLCLGGPLFAQKTLEPFAAEVTYTVNSETRTGKIYSDGHSVRTESEDGIAGQKRVTFVRLDSGLRQMVISRERVYSESPYGAPADAEFIPYLQGAKVQSELLRPERLGDKTCEKVRINATYKGHVYTSIEWMSRELRGFVVKSQDAQGQWSTEYRNIQLVAQPTTLFQVPAGYARIAYSQDWRSVVRQIQTRGGVSQGIAIARKAGLIATGDNGTLLTENTRLEGDFFAIRFTDPVTGSTVLDETINVDYLNHPLPAPGLKSPENGSVFHHFPRKTELQWNAVPGAVSYVVQVDIFSDGGSGNSYWATDKGLSYIQESTKVLSFTFEFAGAQPGRWRVWAIDAHGTEGRKSEWSTFKFTQ